jgi:uncharacterized protein (DUF433 family)
MNAARRPAPKTNDRLRFETPLYTVADAARIVDVPSSTLSTWVKGYVNQFDDRPPARGEAVVTYISVAGHRQPSVPFVGLAEALVLAAVRKSGVPIQRIRPALSQLQTELGVEHALASRMLFTEGAELLFDFGEKRSDTDEGRLVQDLVVVRDGQRVFVDVIREYLELLRYGSDGYPELIRVPAFERAEVVVDPRRAFGAPIFQRGGGRVEDVLERFWAGDSIDELSAEFGVTTDQLEDILRAASRPAD